MVMEEKIDEILEKELYQKCSITALALRLERCCGSHSKRKTRGNCSKPLFNKTLTASLYMKSKLFFSSVTAIYGDCIILGYIYYRMDFL